MNTIVTEIKGTQTHDAVHYYCPYIPLQLTDPGLMPDNERFIGFINRSFEQLKLSKNWEWIYTPMKWIIQFHCSKEQFIYELCGGSMLLNKIRQEYRENTQWK